MRAKKLYWSNAGMGPIRIDDWPNPPRPNITISWHSHNHVGRISIFGSFYNNPTDEDWFEVFDEEYIQLNGWESSLSRSGFINLQARIIWLKAVVETDSGRVDRILVI